MATRPLKLLVWKVRGLNTRARRNTIYQVVAAVDPSIIYFQETNMEVVMLEIVKQCLRKFGNFYYLMADNTWGGILLAWDPLVVTLSNPHIADNTLSALI